MPMTATDSTLGRKKMMRKNFQPRTRSNSSTETMSATKMTSGTEMRNFRLLRKTWCTIGSASRAM